MPHAMIAVATWVGNAIVGAITAAAPTALSTSAAIAIAQAATVATLAVEVAGVYELNKALQPKVGGSYGSQVDFKADPQAGIPYVVGRTGVAGNIVFAQTAGSKNSWLSYVSVYSLGPIDSYESFSVNGTAITFGTDSGEGASGYYQNRMWRLSQLGATPEASYLHPTATGTKDTPADHSGFPSEWSSSHKLSGLAADLWILQYNTDRYSAGTPQRLAVIKGVKVYDPRLDSTYPGGSGSHRSNNEATWAWSANPYLHALTWLIGRTQNSKRVMGVGIPTTMIDMPAFVEGANVADANGWTCGGEVYSTDDKWEVLKALLQAGGGKPMRLGAKVSCLVNTPRTSLANITKADVVGDVSVAGTTSRRTRINTVWPRYRDESQGWRMVTPDAPVTVSSYVTQDSGNVRSRALEYPMVQGVNQACQLAYYDIADGREFTPVTLPCKPIWMGYKPGDCITATEPEWGMSSQKLLILRRQRDPMTMQVTLVCRAETDAKHAAALALSGTGPSTSALTAVDPNAVGAPASGIYTAAGVTITSTISVPAIRVSATVNAPDNPHAVALLIRYRVNGTSNWLYWPGVAIAADRVDITGVIAGAAYDVEVAYRSNRGGESSYTACSGGPFTAGSLTVGGAQVAAAQGTNAIVDAGFRFLSAYWTNVTSSGGSWTNSVGTTGNVRFFQRQATGTPGAGVTVTMGQGFHAGLLPCKPGDRVEGSCYLAGSGVASAALLIEWFDSSGSFLGNTSIATLSGSPAGGTFSGGIDGQTRLAGFATAPASADYAELCPVWVTTGAATPFIQLGLPLIRLANSAQAEFTPWSPGVEAQLGADITSTGTAAAIAGQSLWATYGGLTPSTVAGQVTYLDSTGRIIDGRGLPNNAVTGHAGQRTIWPLSSDDTHIYISAAYTEYRPGANISVPTAVIGSLSAGTDYDVFYYIPGNFSVAIPVASSYTYLISVADYVYLGGQATTTSGVYSPAPPPPSGSRYPTYEP